MMKYGEEAIKMIASFYVYWSRLIKKTKIKGYKMNCIIFNLSMHRSRQLQTQAMCFLLFISTLFFSFASTATLLITPSRVVFEDRTRSEQVTLTNKGDEETTYRISFVRKNMTEDGKFETIDKDENDKDGMYSDTMVRYSPRQVVLAPGQSQVIRLLLRKPKGLADGEYRSHLLMQALPKVTTSDVSKAVEQDADGIKIEITTVLGITIPVIVRKGSLDASLDITNVRYVKSTDPKVKSHIEFDMNRKGSQSVYGDFRVTHSDGSNETIVSIIKGVAVYTPTKLRHIKLQVNASDGQNFSKGSFHITYSESGKDESTGLIASADLKI